MPLGRSLGIKSTKTKPPVSNKELEVTYAKNTKLNHKLVSNSLFSIQETYLRHFISTDFDKY